MCLRRVLIARAMVYDKIRSQLVSSKGSVFRGVFFEFPQYVSTATFMSTAARYGRINGKTTVLKEFSANSSATM